MEANCKQDTEKVRIWTEVEERKKSKLSSLVWFWTLAQNAFVNIYLMNELMSKQTLG